MGAELSPGYWHAKAEETRTLADSMRHRESKAALIKIAEGYERLAKTAEEMRSKNNRFNPEFVVAPIANKITEVNPDKAKR